LLFRVDGKDGCDWILEVEVAVGGEILEGRLDTEGAFAAGGFANDHNALLGRE